MDAIMEARPAKREALHPVSYYWNIVKEMDDSQKLELMAVIIDSMKNRCPAKAEQKDDFRPYSMAEIDAMLDEAEAEISAGKGIPDEEVWKRSMKRNLPMQADSISA